MARKSFLTAPQVKVKGFPDMWNLQPVINEAVSMSLQSSFSSSGFSCRSGLRQGCLPQGSQVCDFWRECDPGYPVRYKTSPLTRTHFSQG